MPSSHDSADPIEQLIGQAVQVLEQRGEPGLQEFLTVHGTHAGAVRDGLERLRRLGILAPPPAMPTERLQFGEFRVLRRIGTGGMGVVYAAEQTSLQRTVALKVVRPEFLLSKSARERFQREVEAIARLQHPGIVPILAVGTEATQPWFAMEYVDGHTLEDLIGWMQDKDPARAAGDALRTQWLAKGSGSGASSIFAGSYWEVCVRLVQQVATTMAYVHEQGIVHRDLKPSNLVVTKQGQALVLDFGLAHVRDLQRLTQEAKPMGTPAYASPEQVRGEAVDERVDIYGLGVTLYELLTTRLPFESNSAERLQQAILAGDARGVRSWNRAVPRDLEIVCSVAIDRDRTRRYRSMADFAADLGAVLARRPIRAHAVGLGVRTVRWVQRHPALSTVAAALLVVALQFPLVLWQLQAASNRQLAAANAELGRSNAELHRSNRALDQQRAEAVRNRTDALDAVQQVVVGSAQKDLINAPGGEQAQLAMLRRAEAMYERLRRRQPNDRRLAFDSARNLQHLGTQLGRLGDTRQAEQQFRAALERLEPWTGADFAYLRGSVQRLLGLALDRRGERDGAATCYEQAYCSLETAVLQIPGDPVVLRQFIEAIASLAGTRGRTADSRLRLLQESLQRREELYAAWPQDQAAALTLALGCDHLAAALAQADHGAALQHANRGLEVLAQLDLTGPEATTIRARLASLYDTRGTLHEAAQLLPEARQDHGQALALRTGLAHDFPAVAQYGFEIGCSLNNLAMAERGLAGPEHAAGWYAEAIAQFKQAVQLAPARVEFTRGLVTALSNRGLLLTVMQQPEAAAAMLDELDAVAKEPTAHLTAARLAVRLAGRRTAAADAAAAMQARALGHIEAAIAAGFTDRGHFDTGALAREYDPIRALPRFQAALARLGPER